MNMLRGLAKKKMDGRIPFVDRAIAYGQKMPNANQSSLLGGKLFHSANKISEAIIAKSYSVL